MMMMMKVMINNDDDNDNDDDDNNNTAVKTSNLTDSICNVEKPPEQQKKSISVPFYKMGDKND
jgi:hypothetical protein